MSSGVTLSPAGHVAERKGKTRAYKRDLSSPVKPLRTIAASARWYRLTGIGRAFVAGTGARS